MVRAMRIHIIILLLLLIGLSGLSQLKLSSEKVDEASRPPQSHWFVLHRQTQKEDLYFGVPGDKTQSRHLRTFRVKTGRPYERPTPLPQLVGRDYWRVIGKESSADNPETAPYFITLDVPTGEEEPFGPEPYKECHDPQTGEIIQCNWELPGAFGLHGVASDEARLSPQDPGSSGCIRHTDADITYLYETLEPEKEDIRYYVEDN